MQAIFDNLISILISSVVLFIFVFLQFRGTMSATEQTINYMVVSEAFNINRLLERDIENMLTEAQTNFSLNAGNFTSSSATFTCNLNTVNDLAVNFTFPTIEFPDSTMNAVDPNNTKAIEVTYSLSAAGDSAMIPVNNVMQSVPLFELVRLVDGDTTASSQPYITDFLVQFVRQGSSDLEPVDTVTPTATFCNDNLAKVRFEFSLATEGVGFITPDQQSTSRQNQSRFGTTVNLTNWE